MDNQLIFGFFSIRALISCIFTICFAIYFLFNNKQNKKTEKINIKKSINTNTYNHEEIKKQKNKARKNILIVKVFSILACSWLILWSTFISINDYFKYKGIKENSLQEISIIKLN